MHTATTPTDAAAELARLKHERWPRLLDRFEEIVPRPPSDDPTRQGDWLDIPEVGQLEGQATMVYCRMVMDGAPGHPLIGMIGVNADRLLLPPKCERAAWGVGPFVGLDEPLIMRFRHWAWDNPGMMKVLRTHLPLRRCMTYGGSSMAQTEPVHELVPRQAVLDQLFGRPKKALIQSARLAFRSGNLILQVEEPGHPETLRFADTLLKEMRRGLLCFDDPAFAEDLPKLRRIPQLIG